MPREPLDGAGVRCPGPSEIGSLAQAVGALLRERQLTLAVAESCTGGLLAAHITSVAGSSTYFRGGVVAYSNPVKQQVLGVPTDILERHGAVSPEVAVAMATGVRRLLQVDLGLATTGIAGPTGATLEKPIGLVYVALASARGEQCRKYLWSGDRRENREWSAQAALELLQEHLCSTEEDPTVRVTAMDKDAVPVLEANAVDARFDPNGRITPLAFEWRGQRLTVAQLGRMWSTGQGERLVQHYLVSAPGEAVFELAFEQSTLRWRVLRSRSRPVLV